MEELKKEWRLVKYQVPKEIVDFLNNIFEITEVRQKLFEAVGIEFSVRPNEINHTIPHIHAAYGEYNISIAIGNGKVLAGNLPKKKQKFAVEWVLNNQQELLSKWSDTAISATSNSTKSRLGTCMTDN